MAESKFHMVFKIAQSFSTLKPTSELNKVELPWKSLPVDEEYIL